jgi:hypothetical protein
MPVEHTSWMLPAAQQAYKHRKDLLSAWERLTATLFGEKKAIAFTGMPGVGKTVLFDHLIGRAFRRGYAPPLTSQSVEAGRITGQKKRINLSVIPGQDAPPRIFAISNIFRGKKPVDGVIHVVANGFIEIRSREAKEALTRDAGLTTLNHYRAHQLGQELRDLDSTCELIRQTIFTHRKPTWMLVTAAKADLYFEAIKDAESYYSPHGDSRFADRMRQLQLQVGSDNFTWDALPVCAWLEDFQWNGDVQFSTLKPNQRDHILAAFAEQVEKYCEH